MKAITVLHKKIEEKNFFIYILTENIFIYYFCKKKKNVSINTLVFMNFKALLFIFQRKIFFQSQSSKMNIWSRIAVFQTSYILCKCQRRNS